MIDRLIDAFLAALGVVFAAIFFGGLGFTLWAYMQQVAALNG